MRWKNVCTWSAHDRKLRLFRLTWERGTVGDGHGYSSMFTLGVSPQLYGWYRGFRDYRLTLVGLVFHYKRSYGGHFV